MLVSRQEVKKADFRCPSFSAFSLRSGWASTSSSDRPAVLPPRPVSAPHRTAAGTAAEEHSFDCPRQIHSNKRIGIRKYKFQLVCFLPTMITTVLVSTLTLQLHRLSGSIFASSNPSAMPFSSGVIRRLTLPSGLRLMAIGGKKSCTPTQGIPSINFGVRSKWGQTNKGC